MAVSLLSPCARAHTHTHVVHRKHIAGTLSLSITRASHHSKSALTDRRARDDTGHARAETPSPPPQSATTAATNSNPTTTTTTTTTTLQQQARQEWRRAAQRACRSALTAFRAARDDFDGAGAEGREAAQRAADAALSASHARVSAAALRPLLLAGGGVDELATVDGNAAAAARATASTAKALRRAAQKKHAERLRTAVAELRASVEGRSAKAVAAMTAALEAVEALLLGVVAAAGGAPASSSAASVPVFASLPLAVLAAQLRRVRDMYSEELQVVRRGVVEGFKAEVEGTVGGFALEEEEEEDGEEEDEEQQQRERRQRERLTVALAAWGTRPCLDPDAADRALATLADEMVGF
jgi:hypothetical protein